jgi:hypothetical protein
MRQRTQTPPLDDISLHHLEDCDGCEGRSDEFYGYTGLEQQNNTSTGHVRDEYREQFGQRLGQHRVNTLGGHRVNTLGGAYVNTLRGVRVNIGIIRMG